MVWMPTPTEENLDEEAERLKGDDRREFYAHIFNGCYAVLMFVVVIFFLIYGVEVFFKVSRYTMYPSCDVLLYTMCVLFITTTGKIFTICY